MRKALSPVLATVFLVLFVMILGVIIYLWAQGFLEEHLEKFGRPIDSLCSEIKFDAKKVAGQKNQIEITNRGNIDIFKFSIKIEKDGDTKFEDFEYSAPARGSARGDFGIIGKKATIYPVIIGKSGSKNKIYTCINNGKTINL
ncbi:hypothetical protein D6829_02700 [Candidatus Pacearchaeota archaeon]|nr:MAG: hypothetical protein D6829_02700 [Candidatus Pacearchaeota archaeon]